MAVRVMDYPTARSALREGLEYADEIEQSYCRHVLAATSAHARLGGRALGRGRGDRGAGARRARQPRGALGSRDVARPSSPWAAGDVDRARALSTSRSRSAGRAARSDLHPAGALGPRRDRAGRRRPGAARSSAATRRSRSAGAAASVRCSSRSSSPASAPRWRPAGRTDARRWLDHVRDLAGPAGGLARPGDRPRRRAVRLADGLDRRGAPGARGGGPGWDARGRIWEATWARLDLARASCDATGSPTPSAPPRGGRETTADAARQRPAPWRASTSSSASGAGAASRTSRGAPLTVREFEVARLIAAGLTNAEIAEELATRPKTASAHVEHILAKLA